VYGRCKADRAAVQAHSRRPDTACRDWLHLQLLTRSPAVDYHYHCGRHQSHLQDAAAAAAGVLTSPRHLLQTLRRATVTTKHGQLNQTASAVNQQVLIVADDQGIEQQLTRQQGVPRN